MASGMSPSKRFAVRLSLVTSSTVALIIGAQSLATLDQVNAAPADSSTVAQVVPYEQAAPSITILRHAATTQAAPSVSIRPRTANTASSAAAAPALVQPQVVMQPPVPVVVSASAQPLPSIPTTRSSR